MAEQAQILIVGGGLVGTSLALALDAAGCPATLLEAAPPQVAATGAPVADDNDRNLVLGRASVNALRRLGVWQHLDAAAGVIRCVEISRAGEFGRVRLTAKDMGTDTLGRVVPGRLLGAALERQLALCNHIRRLAPAKLTALAATGAGWRARVQTPEGVRECDTRLVVGADGTHSQVRAELGIAAREHDYGQSLFVATVTCGQDLPGRAFERFTDAGPIALLPLSGRRRGLVLTVAAARHDEVMALDDAGFVALAQQRFGWKLGRLAHPGKRFVHRIARVLADTVTARRAVLVGNAAQTVHPVGAQGFNLGLRDALTLAELVACEDDPGRADLLARYAARRRIDREGVLAFSHGLAMLGCLPAPALAPLRSLVLVTLDRAPWLRHALARHGMGFRGVLPQAVLETVP